MGYTAERSRFLEAVSGGAEDAGKTSKLNAVVYGGDRWARYQCCRCSGEVISAAAGCVAAAAASGGSIL
jgi:hypothetical protein